MAFLTLANCALAQSAPHDPVPAAQKRGAEMFQRYCTLCHGAKGDGMGVAAKLHNPRPANLTISPYPREYMEKIIRGGGAVVGRSGAMPSWEEELGDAGVADVLVYLQSIKAKR
jgi:mono/diheme cytochrome c family protein